MLKFIGVAVVVVAGVLIYAGTKPDTFRVERTTSIQAPPEKIFPLVNDLHRHGEWSPWEKKDPAMQRAHSGAPSGKGAVYEWNGNKEIGQGRMEITESQAPERVVFALHFIKPLEAHNTAEIALRPRDGVTNVTWSIEGPMPYLSKVFSLFCNMDKMIGREFEKGLGDLKLVSER